MNLIFLVKTDKIKHVKNLINLPATNLICVYSFTSKISDRKEQFK